MGRRLIRFRLGPRSRCLLVSQVECEVSGWIYEPAAKRRGLAGGTHLRYRLWTVFRALRVGGILQGARPGDASILRSGGGGADKGEGEEMACEGGETPRKRGVSRRQVTGRSKEKRAINSGKRS